MRTHGDAIEEFVRICENNRQKTKRGTGRYTVICVLGLLMILTVTSCHIIKKNR